VTLAQESSSTSTYLGFDLNTYPGDDALPILRKTFSFAGYWLNPPPGAKQSNWVGKRQLLLAQKFGFLLLYNGPLIAELKSSAQAAKRGTADAASAAAASPPLTSASGGAGVEQQLGRNFMLRLDYGRDYQKGGTFSPTGSVNHNRGSISISYNFTRPLGR